MEKDKEKISEEMSEEKAIKKEMDELSKAAASGLKEAGKEHIKTIDEEFLANIKVQEEEIKKDFPDFDLKREIEKNPMFAVMLSFNQPVMKVYAYFNPQILKDALEQQILERIKARDLMPEALKGGSNSSKFDINNLSDSDIAEIDKRVRRGERIEL